jgi:hypothetical protein
MVADSLRRFLLRGLISIFSIQLTGCGLVMTEQPIYDGRRDAIVDPRLPGIWSGNYQDGNLVVVIARGEGKRYRLLIPTTQPGPQPASEEADLISLGSYEYLFPVVPGSDSGTLLFASLRVKVHGREMRLSMVNGPEMTHDLELHPELLEHRLVPAGPAAMTSVDPSGTTRPTTQPMFSNMVLTATPEKIRSELIRHEDDPHWFTEILVLKRRL